MTDSVTQLANEYSYIRNLEGETTTHQIQSVHRTDNSLFLQLDMPLEQKNLD